MPRTPEPSPASDWTVRPLDGATWDAYPALIECHGGIWGGCWCMAFHPEGVGRGRTPQRNREDKACRLRDGTAHAALVFDGPECVGWCQYGRPDELPRIKHRRAHVASRTVSASFLHNGSVAMFERHGFPRVRALGRHHWLVQRSVEAGR